MRYAFLTFLCCCCLILPHAALSNDKVVLVYASHMADIQDTGRSFLPRLATLLKQLRADNADVVFIYGGNALGPSALSSFDKGTHLIALLNLLEPTVMTAGRRDFMHKEDELTLRAREAAFPIVCSNVTDFLTQKEPSGLVRTELLDLPKTILGIAALVSPEMETAYMPEHSTVTGGYALLPDLAQFLRDEGADFVIASADFLKGSPETIVRESGVDLLFFSDGDENRIQTIGGQTYALYGNRESVLILNLERDASNALTVEGVIEPLAGYERDPEVVAAIAKYSESLVSLLSVPVGVTTTDVHTLREQLRTEENAFANLVADAIRDYYDTDVALFNAGGLRGNKTYPAGTVLTRNDLQTEMPLHDASCLTQLSGKALLKALEHGVSGVESARGRFLQVSGLNYSFSSRAPVGSRVRSVTVHGEPLDPDTVYTVSAPTYLVHHGDGFTMFSGRCDPGSSRPPQELVEIVRAYIAHHAPIAPQVEGRISHD